MNFLPGTLRRHGGSAQVELDGGVCLPAPGNAGGEDGQSVIYGTRPEHIELADGADGVPATVVVVEPTGADTQVYSTIAGKEVVAVFQQRHVFRPGLVIRLKPDTGRAFLFDAASGARLAA